ncbi:enolase C-terminal domain-like protein [Bosea sp. BK604]|uniref:enolase C-terminal domain-like protein n=1 Tax=Bosea sp. BK604 TaxID=2512180 RepID=UPI0010525F41|nr:enolase C-terminal domain-like protein [Bosea sp. BK604]TCR63047.1 L-alanine-DL-glutamate epimerase-like enolase superfamily enzyme [Bosea sp. BK604]
MSAKRETPEPGTVITRVELRIFSFPIENVARGIDLPGAKSQRTRLAVRIETRDGSRGEYVGGNDTMFGQARLAAKALVGFGALEREHFYEEMKRDLRKTDRMGVGVFDNALWDLAGKRFGASVSDLLGGSRGRLPAYASTWHGGEGGGLDRPEDYVAFAEECRELGYRGFKVHGWKDDDPEREAQNVLLLGKSLAGRMALMIDPGCHLRTFADALLVGRACDEAGFYWYEDPFSDGGLSSHAHRRLRELIKTPLLIGEHVRGLEAMANLLVADGTDFVRADPDFDMGITGTMKIAHLAEALGLDVELHAPGPAQRACMSAIRNSNFYELSMVGPSRGCFTGDFYTCGYSDALDSVGKDGCFPVPQRPGLGVDYDWGYIEKQTLERYEHKL